MRKKELLVKTNNPNVLDETIQSLGGLVCMNNDGSYKKEKDYYTVRSISGDIDFLKFTIIKQGYGEILGERNI